ncbi:hypothetical protein JL101_030385 (plasmid) [Skermanella rosea]|uniref:ribonuclease toxin HepT-like protein n=1 Tax=Skermanella rosea TaxID=1817965 RepID=UPI0019335CA8|nr:hypothetical protein [Skermanella rosea]UEM06802.1 hypothetical protein JL101_030385 [Skermanella rosea]
MNPALWADIGRDLDAATRYAESAARRAASLESDSGDMDEDIREDREAAIGLLLHNCYGALESALERIIRAIDGALPNSSSFHSDLIRRAQVPVQGVRPAVISPETGRGLQKLRAFRHVFRHAYDGYDYSRAAENVSIAAATVPAFRQDVRDFEQAMGRG